MNTLKESAAERYKNELLKMYKQSGYAGNPQSTELRLPREVEENFPTELFEPSDTGAPPADRTDNTARQYVSERTDNSARQYAPERTDNSSRQYVPERTDNSARQYVPERTDNYARQYVPERTDNSSRQYVPERTDDYARQYVPERTDNSSRQYVPERTDDYAGQNVPVTDYDVTQPRLEPVEENCPTDAPCGFLQVEVTAGDTDIPIEDAHIAVYSPLPNGERELYRFALTDESGKSPSIPLPAPSEVLSQTPNPNIKPYSEYTIRITANRFHPLEDVNVPIFAGIMSNQPASLTPFSEYELTPNVTDKYVVESEPDL